VRKNKKIVQTYLHILLQTHFNPMRTNATVHQLNVAPNQPNIVIGKRSLNKYKIPTPKTAQLNQHGHEPSVGHTAPIAFIAFFAIINTPR